MQKVVLNNDITIKLLFDDNLPIKDVSITILKLGQFNKKLLKYSERAEDLIFVFRSDIQKEVWLGVWNLLVEFKSLRRNISLFKEEAFEIERPIMLGNNSLGFRIVNNDGVLTIEDYNE